MTDTTLPPALPLSGASLQADSPVCIWDLKARLGEGPVWSRITGKLWFVNILGRRIHSYDPASGATASWPVPVRPCFLAPTETQDILAGMEDGIYRFSPGTGELTCLRRVEEDKPGTRLNDGHVDQKGRLWFGSMDDGEEQPLGSLYSLTAERGLIRHHGGYTVSNGPAVSPDGRTLYECDSGLGVIYVFHITEDGDLTDRRIFARLEDGAPDGLAMDSAGTLWSGVWGGGRIERFRPDGSRLPPVPVPARNVTKVAFGGEDARTVFITTARNGLDDATLAAEPQTGGLFCMRTDTPGLVQPAVEERLIRQV